VRNESRAPPGPTAAQSRDSESFTLVNVRACRPSIVKSKSCRPLLPARPAIQTNCTVSAARDAGTVSVSQLTDCTSRRARAMSVVSASGCGEW